MRRLYVCLILIAISVPAALQAQNKTRATGVPRTSGWKTRSYRSLARRL